MPVSGHGAGLTKGIPVKTMTAPSICRPVHGTFYPFLESIFADGQYAFNARRVMGVVA